MLKPFAAVVEPVFPMVKSVDVEFAVEEPIRANDYPGMRRVAAATGLKIILDESFLRLDQLENL